MGGPFRASVEEGGTRGAYNNTSSPSLRIPLARDSHRHHLTTFFKAHNPQPAKMHAAVRTHALRALGRPAVSRFQPSALPQVVGAARSFSASSRRSYEFIEVSEPRPGVGQGTPSPSITLSPPPASTNPPK